MGKRKYFWQKNTILVKYIAALLVGVLMGFKIIPLPVDGILFLLLCLVCFVRALQKDVTGFFVLIPFAIFSEIFMRGHVRWVPYLTLQYLIIACFSIFLIKGVRQRRAHFGGFIFLALYMLMELLNNLEPDKSIIGRVIITQSFALCITVVWASFNVLKPVMVNKLLINMKIAGIFLTGIVLVAHLQGNLNYKDAVSSSDASNGMAPVQLSGYLGTICVLFFLSVMNPDEFKTRWLNVVLLSLVAIVMVLTFSRGGIYFVGATIALFLYYNRKKLGSYLKFIFLVPLAYVIYTFVVDATGGAIVQRYDQKGSSNRDVLVEVGFKLFLRNPITGVGTGNYNTQIVKQHLFSVESGAHNEFIRSAAEHGIIGVILYGSFFFALYYNIKKRGTLPRQYAMYFFVLFCLITVHNGLKISLQPFIIMLAVGITSPKIITNRKDSVVVNELPEAKFA